MLDSDSCSSNITGCRRHQSEACCSYRCDSCSYACQALPLVLHSCSYSSWLCSSCVSEYVDMRAELRTAQRMHYVMIWWWRFVAPAECIIQHTQHTL
jgi:hypothetical protein